MFINQEFLTSVFLKGKYKAIEEVKEELENLDKDVYSISHKEYFPSVDGFSNNEKYKYDIFSILDNETGENYSYGRLNFNLFGEWIPVEEFFSEMVSERVKRESYQTEGVIINNAHSQFHNEVLNMFHTYLPCEEYLSVEDFTLGKVESLMETISEEFNVSVNYLGRKRVYKQGGTLNGLEEFVEVFKIIGNNQYGDFPLYVWQEYKWDREARQYRITTPFQYIKRVVEQGTKFTTVSVNNPE